MFIERVTASITELNSTANDIYMSLEVLLLSSRTNLNGAKFTPEFIHEIVKNKEFYTGLPLVCEKEKLEKGKFKSLGHALNKKTGEFSTQQIGSYVDFSEKECEDSEWELFGSVRIFKRFEKVCEAIIQLYESDELSFSVEVFVQSYNKKENGVREISESEGNKIFGDAIVSFAAEPDSKATLLIAEALNIDLNNSNINLGGENLQNTVHKTMEDFFEKSKTHFENCELDIGQVQRKVYNKCVEKFGNEFYNYYSTDFGINFMIVSNYCEGDYYRIDYTVSDNDVSISEMYKVTKNYVPIEDKSKDIEDSNVNSNVDLNPNPIINNKEDERMLAEVQAKLEIAENEIKVLKETVVANETIVSEKDTKIDELTAQVNTLSETVVLKDNEIAELATAKVELDKVNLEKSELEVAEKKIALKEKYSKLLTEEVLASVEIAEAIESLNEGVLQSKVVESALEKAALASATKTEVIKPTMVTASRITDDITIGDSDVMSKYITIGK